MYIVLFNLKIKRQNSNKKTRENIRSVESINESRKSTSRFLFLLLELLLFLLKMMSPSFIYVFSCCHLRLLCSTAFCFCFSTKYNKTIYNCSGREDASKRLKNKWTKWNEIKIETITNKTKNVSTQSRLCMWQTWMMYSRY